MKRKILAVATALFTLAGGSHAQPFGPGGGYGPGMMGGYGPGYGMGPGMMGGYGPGYGMAPGMGYGMGPGVMGGYAFRSFYGLDLTAEQSEKIAKIQQTFAKQQWDLMTPLHSPGGAMEQMHSGDDKAARQAYEAMASAQKQMFEASLEMRKQVEAVLTPEQREQLQRSYRGRRGR